MFSLDISADTAKAIDYLGLEMDMVVRKIALSTYTSITKKTPVDTGRARANWNISLDSPNRSVTTSTSGKTPSLPSKVKDRDIWIANNLPYIESLENGSSKQAPNGMVALSVQEVNAWVKNELG